MTSIMELINESNEIMLESTNMMIELQSAFYLEDLIFEYSLIENFDNKNKKIVMEAVNNERKSKLREVISNLCKRIVAIIGRFIEVLQNKFMQTEQFVEKYGRDKIEDAIRNCNKKLADGVDVYNPIGLAFDRLQLFEKFSSVQTDKNVISKFRDLLGLLILIKRDIVFLFSFCVHYSVHTCDYHRYIEFSCSCKSHLDYDFRLPVR